MYKKTTYILIALVSLLLVGCPAESGDEIRDDPVPLIKINEKGVNSESSTTD